MTTIYTSIVEKHFWQWCKAPLVHTGFEEPIKFAKQSVIVLYSQYIEKRYFGNQTPVVPDAIVEHLKNDPASFLVFENNSECYWPPHRENFWNQVYQNTVQRGVAKQQIHFLHNNHVQVQSFQQYFPDSKHSELNWWEIYTYHHYDLEQTPDTEYRFTFFNRSLKSGRTNLFYQLLTDQTFTDQCLYSLQGRNVQTWEDQQHSAQLQQQVVDSFPVAGTDLVPSRSEIQAWFAGNPWQDLPESIDPRRSVYDYPSYFYNQLYYATAIGAINIIAETNTDSPESLFFATEKIFRPICTQTPFIVLSTPGYFKQFAEMGYQSFDSVWDESYDQQQDIHTRTAYIVKLVKQLNNLNKKEFNTVVEQTQSIAAHNKQNLIERTQYNTVMQGLDPELRSLFQDQVDLAKFFRGQ